MVECEFLPLPHRRSRLWFLPIAGAHGWIAPGRSDVDYAEFEANRMTAEDRAFFDENGYVRPPLPALPLRLP